MKKLFNAFILLLVLMLFMGSTTAQTGTASFYGSEFRGRPTASGEKFNPQALTAAHPSLPFGAILRVTTMDGRRFVDVRVNDRGPFAPGRVLDLSPAAFKKIAPLTQGLAKVRYWRVK